MNTVRKTARVPLLDLPEGQTIYYAPKVGGTILTAQTGAMKVLPTGAADFSFCFASCTETGSTHPVFAGIAARTPDFFCHLGDFHYGEAPRLSEEPVYDGHYNTQLQSAAQRALYDQVALFPMIDDHDYGVGAESDEGRLSRNRRFAVAAFRRRMTAAPFAEPGPQGALYYAWTVGRLRLLMLDCMTARDPVDTAAGPAKTMLGAAQLGWLQAQMLDAQASGLAICLISPKPWIGATGGDGWGSYVDERAALAQFISDNGLAGRVMMLNGDMHGLAIDDGTNADYSSNAGAAIPVFVAGPLDRSASEKGGPWAIGKATTADSGQFGEVQVTDTGGATLGVTWQARNSAGQVLITHSFSLATA